MRAVRAAALHEVPGQGGSGAPLHRSTTRAHAHPAPGTASSGADAASDIYRCILASKVSHHGLADCGTDATRQLIVQNVATCAYAAPAEVRCATRERDVPGKPSYQVPNNRHKVNVRTMASIDRVLLSQVLGKRVDGGADFALQNLKFLYSFITQSLIHITHTDLSAEYSSKLPLASQRGSTFPFSCLEGVVVASRHDHPTAEPYSPNFLFQIAELERRALRDGSVRIGVSLTSSSLSPLRRPYLAP
ncbi:hypothetical protein EVAR_19171_1 [Eumeta japonica]|uniref:Uncharacterized protein n=1 Tax=Eumeta variegata TaxID=151549 RepID=A0A4C1VNQ1_EUMVA|nr:hypothetical protein EVAR_19171_1 [Eumeta japonica]